MSNFSVRSAAFCGNLATIWNRYSPIWTTGDFLPIIMLKKSKAAFFVAMVQQARRHFFTRISETGYGGQAEPLAALYRKSKRCPGPPRPPGPLFSSSGAFRSGADRLREAGTLWRSSGAVSVNARGLPGYRAIRLFLDLVHAGRSGAGLPSGLWR